MYFYIQYIIIICYQFVQQVKIDLRSKLIFITLTDSKKVEFILSVLKYHSKFLFLSLVDLTAVDCLGLKKSNQRFKVVYILISHYFSTKLYDLSNVI